MQFHHNYSKNATFHVSIATFYNVEQLIGIFERKQVKWLTGVC